VSFENGDRQVMQLIPEAYNIFWRICPPSIPAATTCRKASKKRPRETSPGDNESNQAKTAKGKPAVQVLQIFEF
jgi:hypothetical protein